MVMNKYRLGNIVLSSIIFGLGLITFLINLASISSWFTYYIFALPIGSGGLGLYGSIKKDAYLLGGYRYCLIALIVISGIGLTLYTYMALSDSLVYLAIVVCEALYLGLTIGAYLVLQKYRHKLEHKEKHKKEHQEPLMIQV